MVRNEQLFHIQTNFMTGGVVTVDGIIKHTAPILKRFIGQPIENLARWKEVIDIQEVHTDDGS